MRRRGCGTLDGEEGSQEGVAQAGVARGPVHLHVHRPAHHQRRRPAHPLPQQVTGAEQGLGGLLGEAGDEAAPGPLDELIRDRLERPASLPDPRLRPQLFGREHGQEPGQLERVRPRHPRHQPMHLLA